MIEVWFSLRAHPSIACERSRVVCLLSRPYLIIRLRNHSKSRPVRAYPSSTKDWSSNIVVETLYISHLVDIFLLRHRLESWMLRHSSAELPSDNCLIRLASSSARGLPYVSLAYKLFSHLHEDQRHDSDLVRSWMSSVLTATFLTSRKSMHASQHDVWRWTYRNFLAQGSGQKCLIFSKIRRWQLRDFAWTSTWILQVTTSFSKWRSFDFTFILSRLIRTDITRRYKYWESLSMLG